MVTKGFNLKHTLHIFMFITALTLSLCMLTGCAAFSSENTGVYTCVQISINGETAPVDALYDAPPTLLLSLGGKAKLTLGADDFSGSWRVDGENATFTFGNDVSRGTAANGVCVLNLANSGVEYTFLRDGASLPTDADSQNAHTVQTPLQQAWNGDWYGWWAISNADGDWQTLDRQTYDLFARISIDGDGAGTFTLWDEELSADKPMARVTIQATQGEDDAMGSAVSTGGRFWRAPIAAEQWTLAPTVSGVDSMLVINDHYTSDEGSFDYTLVLRPWGSTWDDIADVPEYLPYYYADWYLPLIEAGEAMPDIFEKPINNNADA